MAKPKPASVRLEELAKSGGIAFIRDLNAETDRGCALLASAYIEEALEHAIRERLSWMGGSRPEHFDALLLDWNGPLGSFANRILFARAINLVPEKFADAMKAIKDIRNGFAHRDKRGIRPAFTVENIAPLLRALDRDDYAPEGISLEAQARGRP